MRRAGLIAAVWLMLASVCWGQSVKLPAEVKTEPGLFAVVRAETDCGSLQWVAMDTGLALLPPELLKDSRVAVVQAVKAGRYRLLAYGAKGDVASPPAICTVVVGEPGPGPGPGPEPEPTDPFVGALQAAYAADGEPGKAEALPLLAELYRQGAKAAKQTDLATWGALFGVMKNAAGTLGVSGKLQMVQSVINGRLKERLPSTTGSPLDAAGRQLAEREFLAIAEALDKVRR